MDVLLKLVAILVVTSAKAVTPNNSKQASKMALRRRAPPEKVLAIQPTKLFGDFSILDTSLLVPQRHTSVPGGLTHLCSRDLPRCFSRNGSSSFPKKLSATTAQAQLNKMLPASSDLHTPSQPNPLIVLPS